MRLLLIEDEEDLESYEEMFLLSDPFVDYEDLEDFDNIFEKDK